MKWLEKHWVVVALVVLVYLYMNGSLSNILGGGSVANVTVPTTTNDGNQWYGGV